MTLIIRASICWLLGAVAALTAAMPARAGDGEVTFIQINDIHGHLVPRSDMRAGSPTYGQSVGGLAYVYDQIEKIRRVHPDALLINCGDTIQGSAEALFSRGQALVDVINLFKVDAYVPGNWDYVYGAERFRELFAGDKPAAPWGAVAANLYYATLYDFPATPYVATAGQRVLPPYIVKQVGNVRVGILGLTAERGPQAVSTHVMDGFTLTPGIEELAAFVPLLREKEKVDLVVLISERGLAPNKQLVERVRGVDLVLSSDMHEETWQVLRATTGTLLIEDGQDGTTVGELTVTVRNRHVAAHRFTAHRITVRNNRPAPAIAAQIERVRGEFVAGAGFKPHVDPISGAVLRMPIDTIIGYTKIGLQRANFSDSRLPAVIEGSSHDFLADAFRAACQAEIGVIRGFRYGTHIAPGPITLEDIYYYSPIGAQIACGYVDGDQIRWDIEKSARGSLTQWVAEEWTGGWLNAYSGVTYDLDPYNEYGFRAQNIRVNGEPLDPEREYRIAGYWYVDNANMINRMPAERIRVLRDAEHGILDASDIVANYLQTLPTKTVEPIVNRVRLLKPLPRPIGPNKEIQPLAGAPRPPYARSEAVQLSSSWGLPQR